ncbi:ABC transporter permease [Halococcus agarilyticus]|uniref:ABC transporter permease n=1 Tax=Halococcus agarilyticus TaxID=1232219 RepID=UPI0006777160|nr:ABC transporter permease [Halococcus agarilyticus]
MSYYVKRIAQTIVVFLSTVTVTFGMYRLMPFGPVEQMKSQLQSEYQKSGQSLSRAQIEQINQQVETLTNIQPDAPLFQQYLSYMEGVLLHADFGTSIVLQEPVFEVLFEAMPWSVFISVYGLALGTTISLLLGAIMAYKEGSSFDTGLTVVSTLTQTVPYYIVAILVLIVFAFQLEWLPTGGKMTPGTAPGLNWPFIAGVVEHAALPVLSSFVAGFGGALAYRGNCVREMGKGYLRLARLRGLSQGRIAIRYVGRNALLPIYTTLMLGVASVFGSSIILEQIFNYRAMGFVTFNALLDRDYPLLMGAFIFFSAITLLGILVADLTYGIIDPRVEGGANRESY